MMILYIDDMSYGIRFNCHSLSVKNGETDASISDPYSDIDCSVAIMQGSKIIMPDTGELWAESLYALIEGDVEDFKNSHKLIDMECLGVIEGSDFDRLIEEMEQLKRDEVCFLDAVEHRFKKEFREKIINLLDQQFEFEDIGIVADAIISNYLHEGSLTSDLSFQYGEIDGIDRLDIYDLQYIVKAYLRHNYTNYDQLTINKSDRDGVRGNKTKESIRNSGIDIDNFIRIKEEE